LRAELNARLAAIFAFFVLSQFEDCRAEIERSHELVRRLGAWRFEQPCLLYLGKVALCEGRLTEAANVLREAQEAARRTGVGFHGPSIQSALALALRGIEERRAALAEGELQIAGGSVGHNQLRFYPDAIDVALELSDWDEADRYASQLAAYTAAEPLPWSDFFIDRGRLLAAVGRCTHEHDHQAAVCRLLEEGERFGYEIAMPALRRAFARVASSDG
jgi:tetratricopeptide (TPR) repeat protein